MVTVGTDWDTAFQAMQLVPSFPPLPPRPPDEFRRTDLLPAARRYTVATTTVWSGLSYILPNNAVKILKHPPPQPNDGRDFKGDGSDIKRGAD